MMRRVGTIETAAMRERRYATKRPTIVLAGEKAVLRGTCTRCEPPKPILYGRLCYEHGTGRRRRLTRPDERGL